MRHYYKVIDPKAFVTLLVKAIITIWLEIQVFWNLMYTKDEEKAEYTRMINMTDRKFLFYKGIAVSAACLATCLQKLPIVMKYFESLAEMNERYDKFEDKGVLYYTELILFPLFYLNNQALIVEMMFIRGAGFSNVSLLDIILKPCYYDGRVSFADRTRVFCCQRSRHL